MKAIILDFDGTVLDTEQAEFKAWQPVYEHYNPRLMPEEWQKRLKKKEEIEVSTLFQIYKNC